ncbi:MAG: ribosome biogenesis GTP-binding protein YihA/YsxC [Oscillospiraceae bacterium]|nr:ribosome biogenesis GTP-binding protein YihA/YsxC [Oscillospiraceae bacterium]
MNLQNTEFLRSAVKEEDFPRNGKPQIVFSGRSNVGKSSVINRLLGRKNFARVGNTPGKTVHINFLSVDGAFYLVDLPGYGYAKVSKSERERWGRLIERYFSVSGLITYGVMIVDARHKPTEDDRVMSAWYQESGCPFVVVANKTDKVKKSQRETSVACIAETLQLNDTTKILPFSAVTGEGRGKLLGLILEHVEEKA